MEPIQDPSGWEFAGTERYRLLRRVGEGGMGVVYEVFDQHRQERLALKTLLRANPAAVYRFKREFRTLADVSHPNLVTLHELVSDGDELFFTMELVEGLDLLRYVRPGGALPGGEAPTEALPMERETIRDEDDTVAEVDPRTLPPLVEERLRDALRQLAEGLVALHDAGKLHRDVKPSNVLVTREGRVVLLDFGLAADLDEESLARSQLGMVVGTVAYMAPEQATGEFTRASDWYSVGVILYQALTGALPFSGSMFKVVLEKQEKLPPPPDEVVPGLPRDLSELCVALLAPNAKQRPVGRDVLRRLGGYVPSPRPSRGPRRSCCPGSSAARATSRPSRAPTPGPRPGAPPWCTCTARPASARPRWCGASSSASPSRATSSRAAATSTRSSPTRPSTAWSTPSRATCGGAARTTCKRCCPRTSPPSPACSPS